ncbi:MAG: transcriptional regulator [Actinomycetota bacterium]|nr:transcriptional regulator [Actinomycetota bacterium]
MENFEQHLESTGALADELRRTLFLFIRQQRRAVGRDEAARAVGISRTLAAFHLDKLVEKGLLTARYVRLTGRPGPGAGRPAKVYEPSGKDVSVSIPFRSYDVVADILLDALEQAPRSKSGHAAVRASARTRGIELGQSERSLRRESPKTKKAALKTAHDVLSERGYEPYDDERGGLRLHNCPFYALAQRSTELVCGINQAFIDGLLEGLGTRQLIAVLDPRPGECCVHVRANETAA